jgi:serine/threonine protein kinase
MNGNFDIKLADFGFASKTEGAKKDYLHYTCKGTLGYMAPELLNAKECMKKGYNGE